MKKQPKDVDARLQSKKALEERLKRSIVEQGGFGVIQTKLWVKAYKNSKKVLSREFPTVASSNKAFANLDEVCSGFKV